MIISVILAVYNEEKYLLRCLESLNKQTTKDLEIIVVDDGSADKTLSVLSKLKIKSQKLKILKQPHQGPAIARNLGVKHAAGNILVFVDADMYFEPDFLEKLIYPIKLGKVKGTFSTEEYVANWNNVWARCWNFNWNLPPKKRINPARPDQQKDFRAILKSEFNRVKGFDNTGYTDTWTLAPKLGYRPTATKALYYHYNPSTLREVFKQAKWAAKRQYKYGAWGKFAALARANFVFSVLIGFSKAIINKEPRFYIFKLVYDWGTVRGLLDRKISYA